MPATGRGKTVFPSCWTDPRVRWLWKGEGLIRWHLASVSSLESVLSDQVEVRFFQAFIYPRRNDWRIHGASAWG